jgi:hypothetical protein
MALTQVPAASASANFTLLNTGGTSLSGTTTTVSFTAHNSLLITIEDASSTSANAFGSIRFNGDSGSNYYVSSWYFTGTSSAYLLNAIVDGQFPLFRMDAAAGVAGSGSMQVDGAKTSGQKPVNLVGRGPTGGNTNGRANVGVGRYSGSSAITSVSLLTDAGTFDAGTIYIYGSN